jgi:sigma-E factor negative regulatory protein RseC
MLEEFGSVIELKEKEIAIVLCQRNSACTHCAARGLCAVKDDDGSQTIEVHNTLGAQPGDKVKVSISTKSFLQSSFLLYIVPLIALIVGAVIGQLVGQHLEEGPDPNLLAAFTGTAFLIGSFFVIRFCTRAIPKEAFMPRITEIISPGEISSEGSEHGH